MSNVRIWQGASPSGTTVSIGPVSLVFSYETVVAFKENDTWTVSENFWGSTTGRHIKQHTPDGVTRTERGAFEAALEDLLSRIQIKEKS